MFIIVPHGSAVTSQSHYYHPDHLGSSSQITDGDGNLVQHLEYLPFGEIFLDRSSSSDTWNTPYKFSGKELDPATGLYYFGARYYDPKTSVWLGVDPLAVKYPFHSPYVYCNNNSVKYIDPNGEDWFENEKSGSVYYNSDLKKGDEGTGKMKGEGWNHMGENNMFAEGNFDPINSDFALLKDNNGTIKFDKNSTFFGELELKDKDAKDFMSQRGFKIVPVESYKLSIKEEPAFCMLPFLASYSEEVWTKIKYMDKQNNMKQIIANSDVLEFSVFGMVTYDQYNYKIRSNNVLKHTRKFINKIAPILSMPFIHNVNRQYIGWDKYPSNVALKDYKK